MKKFTITLFIIIINLSNAQTNSTNQEIEELKNNELKNNLVNQKSVFNKIETFILENSKPNSNENAETLNFSKFDSINMIKALELKNLYRELNSYSNYKLIKNKKEAELVSNFTNQNLKKIDSLYRILLTNKKTKPKEEIKKVESTAPNNNTFPNSNEIVIESRPIHQSCVGSPLGDENCTLDYIRKKMAYGYAMPELREIQENQLRIIVQFRISKTGKIDIYKIVKSSGYFEYDMEALNIFEKISQKEIFTPAHQNGKNVHCSYALPINLMVNQE